ncbi:T6SS effector BTH_I2691 family protein [Burkholderia sp. D-99]|uniref:T6SS effector BTH_I2691 family protein n=1 Tax=Burkholderia sp. D-99 TaxID=2717316 RepID=UPI0014228552|nr:T6SS effector BTH_I2691 family protein [Burkholderia sp. D-99]NHV24991.1 hypothetical protein [Burkholderia sp. D-99]
MSDGKYAQNANAAAAGAPHCSAGGCPSCVKAGLPVLLVRPALAEKKYADAKKGAIAKLKPGVADVGLSYFGYTMRTLRGGYVYAYYERPHTPELKEQKGWQAFQVDDGGYMTPYSLSELPLPGNAPVFACQRTAGYAAAMLFVIPNASETQRVWIGFSDTPWSEKIRNAYGNPKNETLRRQRMVCIDAPQAKCDRSAPLTEAEIGKIVEEYNANYPVASAALYGDDNVFPLRKPARMDPKGGRRETAKDIYDQAVEIVKKSQTFDIGKAMIVSVPDAIGVTYEAANFRITVPKKAKTMMTDKGYWKLQSALCIKGLVETMQQQYSHIGNLSGMQGDPNTYMARDQFDAMKASGNLPPGATFMPQTISGSGMFAGTYTNPSMGIVAIPEDELPAEQIKKKLGDKYQKFLDQYQSACNDDSRLLATIEPDYGAWLQSGARKLVTEHDCDDTTRQDGVYYAVLVGKVCHGGHKTDVGLQWYADFMKDNPDDKNNLMIRAMLGNQQDFFTWFKDKDQRSKTIDESKAFFDVIEELEKKHEGGQLVGALARNLPYLRTLASLWSYSLVSLLSASSLALRGLKNPPSPDLVRKVEVGIARIGIISATKDGIRVTRVKASYKQAKFYWREVANAKNSPEGGGKSTSKVGDTRTVSVSRSGGGAFDVSGKGGTVEVFVFEQVSVTTTAVAQLPADMGELRKFARKVGELMREGGAVLSVAGGWLQVLSLRDAMDKYRYGNDDERLEGILGIGSAAMGCATALFEVGNAAAKKWEAVGAALRTKILTGVAATIAAGFDAATAAMKAASRYTRDNMGAFTAYAVQTLFFLGATVASGAGFLEAIGVITVTGGYGLSWTGWGLVLVAVGMAAGFLAQLLQNRPAEEWAARTIWGSASDKWGSMAREQEESNKLLLGISVDFSYKDGFWDIAGRSAAAGMMGGLPMPGGSNSNPMDYREVYLRLRIPVGLRAQLDWVARIYGKSKKGGTTLLLERTGGSARPSGLAVGGASALAKLNAGVKDQDQDIRLSLDLSVIEFSGAYAEVAVETKDGDEVLSERLPN